MPLTDLWKGDANKGQPLATGITPLTMLEQEWHDFGWLRDMRNMAARTRVHTQENIYWTGLCITGLWDKTLWHPVQLARRIRSLILTWNWYGQSAPESQQMQILTSLIVQSSFYKKTYPALLMAMTS